MPVEESPDPQHGPGGQDEQAHEDQAEGGEGEDRRHRSHRVADEVPARSQVAPVREGVEGPVERREEGGVERPDGQQGPERDADDDGQPTACCAAKDEQGRHEEHSLDRQPGEGERGGRPPQGGGGSDESDPEEEQRERRADLPGDPASAGSYASGLSGHRTARAAVASRGSGSPAVGSAPPTDCIRSVTTSVPKETSSRARPAATTDVTTASPST